ncbi:MAG TPA: glycogen-binding domain-containing protein, partial [Gemmatimonadales bacterium]|nr:glycogen-binding domain-containing protein [Gemmatimonadales bacterium]
TALRLRARGWWQPSPNAPQLSLSVESTAFPGGWYTDLLAGATVSRTRVVVSLWATARISAAYGSKGAASAALQYFATPTLAVEVGGGGYLSDPFQGLPRAGYVTAGVRLHRMPRPLAPSALAPPLPSRLAPLIANKRGDSVVVRFHMEGARSVAIAGDWNAWQPVALRSVGNAVWEAALVLAPGTYQFNLLVDGTEWVVPGGVAVVPDGMGGLVALLTVP